MKFFTGKASGKCIQWVLLSSISIFTLGLLLSYLYYPGSYSILRNSVSSLGNQLKNPVGSWLWRVSFFLTGLSIIVVINYIYNNLRIVARITSRMFQISCIIASVGVSAIGIFPENAGLIHYIFALVAFFGYMFGFCCNIYTFHKIGEKNLKRYSKFLVIVIYIILIGCMAGFIGSFGIFGLYYFWDIVWINPYLPLWEWLAFLGEFFYLIGIFYILFYANIPNQMKSV